MVPSKTEVLTPSTASWLRLVWRARGVLAALCGLGTMTAQYASPGMRGGRARVSTCEGEVFFLSGRRSFLQLLFVISMPAFRSIGTPDSSSAPTRLLQVDARLCRPPHVMTEDMEDGSWVRGTSAWLDGLSSTRGLESMPQALPRRSSIQVRCTNRAKLFDSRLPRFPRQLSIGGEFERPLVGWSRGTCV
ncbi:hypothetical protein LXA43DRAFT_131009 [Ganoderma leucocontextum]|nr:hypothetical protein LXA43DRAFT_131009 [Ganoderma leucocontextum]